MRRLRNIGRGLVMAGLLGALFTAAGCAKCGGDAEPGDPPPAPDEAQRRVLAPSDESTTLSLRNGIAVSVPAGVVTEETELVLKQRLVADFAALAPGWEPETIVEVRLGDLREFAEPLTLTLPLTPELAAADPATLACRTYLPAVADWAWVACAVDPEQAQVRITTHHLSVFGLFKLSTGFDHQSFDHGQWSFRLIWERKVGQGALDWVVEALRSAADVYAQQGFTPPMYRLDVVLLDNPGGTEASYSSAWLFGYIRLPIRPDTTQEGLQHDAAHELFHALQNRELHAIRMHYRHWLVEATAEYAAGYLAYPGNTGMSPLNDQWPYSPLLNRCDSQVYATGHFIAYVLARTGRSLREFWTAIMGSAWRLPAESLSFGYDLATYLITPDATYDANFDAYARALTLDPLKAFLAQHLAPQSKDEVLGPLLLDFLAEALFDPRQPERARLDPRLVALSTRIDGQQLTRRFAPYEGAKRLDRITLAPDYAAQIWRVSVPETTRDTALRLALHLDAPLPAEVAAAIYVKPAEHRSQAAVPVLQRLSAEAANILEVPPGHDLFVLLVNGAPTPQSVALEVALLRTEELRTLRLGESRYELDLPTWLAESAATGEARWEARPVDLQPFEGVRVMDGATGASPVELRAAYERDGATRLRGFTPAGASESVEVAGVEALLRTYRGTLKHTLAQRAVLLHTDPPLRKEAGDSVEIPVLLTTLFVQKGHDAFIIECISAPDDSAWAGQVLRSLRGGVVEGGLVLHEDFSGGTLDRSKFEVFTAIGRGSGFTHQPGTRVSVHNGFARVEQAETDAGGALFTHPIPIVADNVLVIRSRMRAHHRDVGGPPASPQHNSSVSIMDAALTSRRSGVTYVHRDDGVGFYWAGQARSDGPAFPARWDTWFTQELRWDPATGEVSWSIDGSAPVLRRDAATEAPVRVGFAGYGWYTDHWLDVDEVEIRWELAPRVR